MRFLLIVGSLFAANLGFAQEKRIPKADAPSSIKQYILGNYSGFKKDKYYKEVEGNNTFIECEFLYQGEEYSVKFMGDSLIEEEQSIEWEEMPSIAKVAITQYFIDLYSDLGKFRILEIQKINPQSELKFELTVKAKGGNELEFVFDRNGKQLAKIPINNTPIPSNF